LETTVIAKTGFGFEKPGDGKSHDWLTPPDLIKMLGPFDLDPCASAAQADGRIWPTAKVMYTPPQDGLTLPWHGRVFCNPPYGPHVGKWAKRMAEHGNGIFLIFSRTETNQWLEVWTGGDAFLFPHGRISFYLPDGTRAKSGTAPSTLVAYGRENMKALYECGLAGAFLMRAEILRGKKASTL
jgi:hypothetical protein